MSKKRKKPRSSKTGVRNKKVTRKVPTNQTKQVLDLFISKPDKNYTSKEIQNILDAKSHDGKSKIVNVLRQLFEKGKIERTQTGGFCLNRDIQVCEGVVDGANRSLLFIKTELHEEDVKTSSAGHFLLSGDKVKLVVYPFAKGEKNPDGEIIEVLERKKNTLVGTIQDSGGIYFMIPDGRSVPFDLFIAPSHLNGAKNGYKVIAEITSFPDGDSRSKNPEGKVIEVLGKAGDNDTEMHAILAEFDLPYAFPKVVENEAASISEKITEAEIKKRRDFRNVTTFTIDPADAKDLDDALSLQKLENGNWEIGVHIADVTHYIQENSALDQEAQERATSVYLVDRVVPMLPEKLSNRLCSLNPNEDKLTFSAVFELDEHANIVNEWFGRTIINCNKRFAYEDAQEAIEGKDIPFAKEINILNGLADKLKDERFRQGSIAFESVELRFQLDENGVPLSVYIKERKDAHKLIEEFMLLANKKVAEFVFNMRKNPHNTMVYRVHEPPDPEKLQDLKTFVKRFGYDINVSGQLSGSFNKLAEQTEGTAESAVIQNFAIRSMSKAKYTTEPLGHFGLAFNHYSHFTSPIRRFPDMMCHRMLQHYLDKGKNLPEDEYEMMCKHSSTMEKKAADAERASIKYKQVEFMSDSVGKNFSGMVTGVTEWGIYVEIDGTGCEGMVRMADMKDDFYTYDDKKFAAVGRRSKRTITLGDKVKIRIKSTSLQNRTIDLVMLA